MKHICLSLTIMFIIFFGRYKYKHKKHLFWDNQPVSTNKIINEGIISINPMIKIHLKESMYFQYLQNRDVHIEIFNFINNHFSENYQYSHTFLKQTLCYVNHLLGNTYNIGLYDNNLLIGFVHAKPITLFIKNRFIHVYYVDFLCVHTKYRKQNIATFLISKVINSCHSKQIFIFKKENKPLPFNYIHKSSYYYLYVNTTKNISKKNISNISLYDNENINRNIKDMYLFITKIQKKTLVYSYFSFIHFKKYFTNNHKKILVEYGPKHEIIAMLIFMEISFKINDKTLKTYDIENIYINGISNYQILDSLLYHAKQKNVDMISCLEHSYNKYFIDTYNMIKSMPIYFHMYNYHINKPIDQFNFIFNLI